MDRQDETRDDDANPDRDEDRPDRLLFDVASDAVFVMDRHRFRDCNPATLRIYACGRDDILGRSPVDFSPPTQPDGTDSTQAAAERIHAALTEGPQRFDWLHRRLDGTLFDAEVTLTAFRRRGEPLILAVVRDVSARKAAEAELRASEERYRMVAEASGHLVYDYEVPTGVIRWAGAVRTVTGQSPEEFAAVDVGGWAERIHPDDRPAAEASLERSLVAGEPFGAQYRFRRGDGEYVVVEDTGLGIPGPDGRTRRLLGTMKDIGERQEAEEGRRRLESRLAQAQRLESVGRLAGGVAHDFNNLLTAILGNLHLAQALLDPADPAVELLQDVGRAADRAADLTRQLLAYSRRQAVTLKVLRPSDLVVRLERLLRRLIGEHIELRTRLPPEEWRVRGDTGQLEQVVVNLAVNARDAMPDGGVLTVEVSNCRFAPGSEPPAGVPPGDWVAVAVSDTGLGMAPEVLEHVFEPFYTTKSLEQGTGLGLATVLGIVQQHGGRIDVDSAPGRGSRFTLYLPRTLEPEPPAESRRPAAPPPDPSGGETVLLVEDDFAVRQVTARSLEREGYRVLKAPDPETALAWCRDPDRRIDLLLTDLVMPRLDGRRLAEAALQARPGLPVLYCSGYAADVLSRHGVGEGDVDFLPKPFDGEELGRRVRRALGRTPNR